MDWLDDKLIGTGLSVAMIAYIVLAKHSEHTFRKTAVRVPGQVVKRFPRQRYTSYYIAYQRDNLRRVAEYCGPPARLLFDEGDSVTILIDPNRPPDTEVPNQISAAGDGSGNCSLPNQPLFQFWDYLYLSAAVAMLAYTHWR
jgi:hypothetical protein